MALSSWNPPGWRLCGHPMMGSRAGVHQAGALAYHQEHEAHDGGGQRGQASYFGEGEEGLGPEVRGAMLRAT